MKIINQPHSEIYGLKYARMPGENATSFQDKAPKVDLLCMDQIENPHSGGIVSLDETTMQWMATSERMTFHPDQSYRHVIESLSENESLVCVWCYSPGYTSEPDTTFVKAVPLNETAPTDIIYQPSDVDGGGCVLGENGLPFAPGLADKEGRFSQISAPIEGSSLPVHGISRKYLISS